MAKTVMAFGSFDILHPGHLLYLESARKLGDRLIVVVARDRSIAMFKGRKSVFREGDRLRMVSSLRVVDRAVLGNKIKGPDGIYNIIRDYRPDVIAIGYDQRADMKDLNRWLKKNGIKARVVRIRRRMSPARYKSSVLRRILIMR